MNKNLGTAISVFGSSIRDLSTAGGLAGVVSNSPIIIYISIGFIVLGGLCGAFGKAVSAYYANQEIKDLQ